MGTGRAGAIAYGRRQFGSQAWSVEQDGGSVGLGVLARRRLAVGGVGSRAWSVERESCRVRSRRDALVLVGAAEPPGARAGGRGFGAGACGGTCRVRSRRDALVLVGAAEPPGARAEGRGFGC